MSNWPLASALAAHVNYTSGYQSPDICSSSATPHTDGSWAEIIAAADNPGGCGMVFSTHHSVYAAGSAHYAVSIAFGASGSEIEIPLRYGGATGIYRQSGQQNYVPLQIPAGVRIAARARIAEGYAQDYYVNLAVVRSSVLWPVGFARVDHVGFDAANTKGTACPLGTYPDGGAITQLTAATSFRARALLPRWWSSTGGSYQPTWFRFFVGAGGVEFPIGPWFSALNHEAENSNPAGAGGAGGGCIPVDIPAGSRVSARVLMPSYSSGSGFVSCILFG